MDKKDQMFEPALAERIKACGVIAVLVIDRAEHAVLLAKALLDGGVDVMELTLRTPAALSALKAIKTKSPEMLVGAGTVLTRSQVQDVTDAGADFAVSPGLNPSTVQAARALNLSFAPGISTPSDIERAVEMGCCILKFFPAEELGGIAYLKSMAAPYAHLGLSYIPLGGVNVGNMMRYLEYAPVIALGGSWLAKRDLIVNEDWGQITQNAAEARAQILGKTERH
jgi:2-dehydro-3-deoxyphosphogluconate aldolase / (4S)-4-hydroxy-2-oxoglutarate aldolase